MKKSWIVILVVVLLAAVGITAYFLPSKPAAPLDSNEIEGVEGAKFTPYNADFYSRIDTEKGKLVFFHPDKGTRRIPIGKLAEIRIVTTDKGPKLDDCFWLFVTTDQSRYLISNNQSNIEPFLKEINELPNLDKGTLIEAMTVVANAEHVIWKKAL